MQVTFKEKYDHTPTWQNNDKDASPAVFHCRYLSNEEMSDCVVKEFIQGTTDDQKFKVTYKESRLILLSVESIDALNVNGTPITTAAEFLLAKGINGMMRDVVNRIIKENSSRDIKNS
mgnify:CR=1 FL=1